MDFKDIGLLNADERYEVLKSYIPKLKRCGKTSEEIKYLRSVSKGKGEENEALTSGIAVIENINPTNVYIKYLIICPDELYTKRAQECAYSVAKSAQTTIAVSAATFSLLGQKKNSGGLAALVELSFKKIDEVVPDTITMILDSLELPGNVGTLMRTADGAGLKSVVFTNTKVRINNPTLLAASRGAFSQLNIIVDSVNNIRDWAEKNDVTILLADTRAEKAYTDIDLSGRVCFVLGCERYGIDQKWYDTQHEILKIPMLGVCDSLNVGVAGSILVYEALRQQK